MHKIAIIDYGVGNLLSVKRAFDHLGIYSFISRDRSQILSASHVVLPGVGAFGHAIEFLKNYELDLVISDFAKSGRPLLGICLGMQLFFDTSTEFGLHKGLGLIPGQVKSIRDFGNQVAKVPSIGWKKLSVNGFSSTSFLKYNDKYFYFVHSFMGLPFISTDLIATYNYYDHYVPAIVQKYNIIGVQFHPEKSGVEGLNFLQEFSLL